MHVTSPPPPHPVAPARSIGHDAGVSLRPPRRPARWIVLPVLVAACAALLTPASAGAALAFSRSCAGSNFECARLTVPLDRTGATPGTVDLYLERMAGRGPGAVLALAGGPGQGATSLTESFNRDLYGRIGTRSLIVVDQRGTGKSGALDCAALERPGAEPIDVRTATCADQLGPARSHYTTSDSIDDLEAVRAALGIDRITLLGVSYGTKVALAYALRHPTHVERLVLDSVVDAPGQDPFDRDSFAAMGRILRDVCRGECAGVTRDLPGDVAALVRRMPVSGPIVDARGRRRTETVTARELYEAIRSGDGLVDIRVAYPAAVHAARHGDPAPLVRLVHRFDDLPAADPEEVDTSFVQELSFTLQAATLCEEAPLPWERTADPAERDRQAIAAAAAIPDAAFAPFDRGTALAQDDNSLLLQCRRWPATATAPAVTGTYPDVPTLVLAGREDTRTPLEVGARVAARFPRGQVLAVAKTGHAVLGRTPCALTALRRFFADRPLGTPCGGRRRSRAVEPLAPARLDAVRPAPRTTGRAGRTLAAALLTVRDLQALYATTFTDELRGGGLRAGTFRAARRTEVDARGFSFVPGVVLSGRLDTARRMAGRITVSGGAAARGTLRISATGTVRGTLGGRPVRGRYVPPPTG